MYLQAITEIIPKMVDAMGFHKQYRTKLVLFCWNKIVGEEIAAQSAPVSIEFGVLFLSVHNSVWCHHLSMMKPELICKVNQFAGEPIVKDIRFRNQPVSLHLPAEDEAEQTVNFAKEIKRFRLSRDEMEQAERQCAPVEEEKLRKRLLRIYQKQLLLNQCKRLSDWHACACCNALCPKEETHCMVCALEEKQEKLTQIRGLLAEVPWATYGEIHQYVPCTTDEYIDAKVTLLSRLADQIEEDETDSLRVKTLAMLFTGAKHDALNDRLIQSTIAKFRRKTYVSAPR